MEPDALVDGLVGPGESPTKPIDSISPQPSTSAGTLKDTTHLNGSDEHVNGGNSEEDTPEYRIAELEAELERTNEERENYASQYQALLARIQTMRTTLGNKLREDAEELDRREQNINSLSQQNEALQITLETLQSELVQSNDESEKLTMELEKSRSRILEHEQSSREAVIRDRELREVREEAEGLRLEKEETERSLQRERVELESKEETLADLRKDLETERINRIRLEEQLSKETERSDNLRGVLEDFQSGKDMELRNAVQDTQSQLETMTLSLAEYKHRALQAELELENRASSSERIEKLEAEVKEKSLLLGKQRHQAVILNEHLTEALRRLHKSSSDTNVDRRLVTNILLSFLATPRGDTKRFEMLNILSTILGWTDDERERAGLQRNVYGTLSSPTRKGMSRVDSSSSAASGSVDPSESFSNMWVEFLMKEAAQGEERTHSRRLSTSGQSDVGAAGLPKLSPRSDGSSPGTGTYGKRVASLGSLGAMDLSNPPKKVQDKSTERRLL